MSKHSQDRTPRLAIVGPTNSRHSAGSAGPRWWGPQRAQSFSVDDSEPSLQTQKQPASTARMVVMPPSPRRVIRTALAWMWNFVRGYFVDPTEQREGKVVLSFRRYAMQSGSLRRKTPAQDFTGKKSNGSVGWHSDHHAAPQEGGRR